MNDINIEQFKEYKDSINTLLILQAAEMEEKDIREVLAEDIKEENTQLLLIQLGDKLTEIGKPYHEEARKIFNDDSSEEGAVEKYIISQGHSGDIVEYLELDVTWRVLFQEMEAPIEEALTNGASTDDLIKEFGKTLGEEAAGIFVGAVLNRMDPAKLKTITKSIKRKKGNSRIGWGLFWLILGVIATEATDGETLYYGAMLIGVVYIIMGLVNRVSS